jgi:hypothetical protein
MRGSRSGGYKYLERHLGQRGATRPRNGLDQPTWADRPGPTSAQFVASFAQCFFPSLLDPPLFCMWALVVSFCPNWTKLLVSQDSTFFLARSSEFSIFSGWVLGILGVVSTSLLDLYRASRSCHEVLNELIPEVFLSMLKPCINTKLQNRHAQVNLLYHEG